MRTLLGRAGDVLEYSAGRNLVRPRSDIRWLQRWRRAAEVKLAQRDRSVAPPFFSGSDHAPRHTATPSLPAAIDGLREYWYPVLPAAELKKHHPTPVTLCGTHMVLFRGEQGRLAGLEDRCPHRGAMLSLGWTNQYAPGSITCRYHGWTFDGHGTCLAALADGPNSAITKHVSVRSYPVEERYGVVWIYPGDMEAPSLDESVPHLNEIMGKRLKIARYWDWPANYLLAQDNNADIMHPSFAHQTCAQFRDQRLWEVPTVEELECGGLWLGVKGVGPKNRGPHSIDGLEWHLPGFDVFRPRIGEPAGAMFWGVPIDRHNVRMFRLASFGPGLIDALRGRFQNYLMLSPYGRPDNIYHCNKGTDASLIISCALAMDNERTYDADKEHLYRGDKAVIAARRMIQMAYNREIQMANGVAPDGMSQQNPSSQTVADSTSTTQPALDR